MDARSLANIATLTPETQPFATSFLGKANNFLNPKGYSVEIISGSRTYVQQNALYAQGRTAPGNRVTNAPAGYSLHNFGIAFDIGIFSGGKYIDDFLNDTDCDNLYKSLAPIGKGLGLEWGGDWQSICDYPHYQYNPLHLSLSDMRSRVVGGQSLFS